MIYSLRTFLQTGLQEDEAIGRKFQTIYKNSNKEEFDFHLERLMEKPFNDYENIYALIIRDDESVIALYKTHRYYVVTEHGNTYANITYRK